MCDLIGETAAGIDVCVPGFLSWTQTVFSLTFNISVGDWLYYYNHYHIIIQSSFVSFFGI